MRNLNHVSAIALAAAMLAAPQAAQAQLNLGVNVGGNGSGGLGVGVDLGVGGAKVGVGAGVGGRSLVDVDANVGVDRNSSGSNGGSTPLLGVDAEVLGPDDLVDANVTLGTGTSGTGTGGNGTGGGNSGGNGGSSGAGSSQPIVGINLAALDDTVRVDALVDLIASPNLADVDLDELVDDRQVSIIAAADILTEDELLDIRAGIGEAEAGREELLAAIDASVELGAILDREGVDREDVLTVSVGAGGETQILTLDADIDVAALGDDDATPLLDTDLADLDIDLLTDGELAEIDLALLPDEDQRLDAIIRILGDGDGGSTPGNGTIEIIDVEALLGDESLAELDAALETNDGTDLTLTADILDTLDDAGINPEAVIGIGTSGDGTQVVVDAGLDLADLGSDGATDGLLDTELADLDIDLLTDDELAEIDLALLPDEDQRLDAIIRILGDDDSDTGSTPGTGPIEIIDVDALLGDESLAELDAVLGTGDDTDLTLTADILDILDDAGINPAAVIGISTGDDGTQVFVDAGLGNTDVAQVDIDLGGGIGTDAGGDDGTGGDDDGTGGGDDGTGGGDDGTGGGDDGSNGGDDGTGGGDDGTGGGDDGDNGTGGTNGGNDDNGTDGGTLPGTGGNGDGTDMAGMDDPLNWEVGAIGDGMLVADLACSEGLAALGAGQPADVSDLAIAQSIELVRVDGCVVALSQPDLEALQSAIEALPALVEGVEGAGLDLDQLIGGTFEDETLVLYFEGQATV